MLNFPKRLVINGTEWNNNPLKFDVNCIQCNGSTPSWQDIILSGNTALTLVNAKANGLNYVKLFGACEQNGTPTPATPVDIVSNNGALKYGQYGKNLFNVNTMLVEDKAIRAGNTSAVYPLGSEMNNGSWDCTDYISVLPDTTYTYTIPKSVSAGGAGMVFYSDKSVDGAISGMTQSASLTKTFTTPSNCQYVRFSWIKDNTNVVQLELGDTATTYEPYQFGLYTDGTVETVEVHSENLVPLSSSTDFNFSNNILSNKRTDTRTNIEFFVQVLKDNTWRAIKTVSVTSTGVKEYTLDIPSGVTNIKIKHNGARTDLVIATDFVLPEGSYTVRFDCLSYNPTIVGGIQLKDFVFCQTPYFNGGTATAEMLLSVDDYQDEQEVLTGAVTRNVGVKVLDGTENWVYFGSDIPGLVYSNDAITDNLIGAPISAMLCNRLTIDRSSTLNEGSIRFQGIVGQNKVTSNRLYLKINSSWSLEQTTQWLADQYANGTPVIVVYPLEEPTTESVAGQALTTQAGTNIVEITQASIDNLALEVSYKGKQ